MSKYRMYSLVLRQLSPMQKGVQSAHSIVEYGKEFHKLKEYIQWSTVDKTIIILDGGNYKDMKECRDILDELYVPNSRFYEEDLNDMLTSISFIVEDKVWDTENYPSFEEQISDQLESDDDSDHPKWLIDMGGIRNLKLRQFIFNKRLAN